MWLATSDDLAATVTGRYFKRRHELRANPAAYEVEMQERFLQAAESSQECSSPGLTLLEAALGYW